MKIRKYVWLFLYLIPLFPAVAFVVSCRWTDTGAFLTWYNSAFSLSCPDVLEPLFSGLV